MSPQQPQKRSSLLPTFLRSYFWDYDFHSLDWEKDRNLIIKRLLSSGNFAFFSKKENFTWVEEQRMPKLYWDVEWRTVKTTIQGWIKETAGGRDA